MEVHASDWLGGRGLSPAEERHATLWISGSCVLGNVESMRVVVALSTERSAKWGLRSDCTSKRDM